ncbi:DNA-binding protein [Rhodocyclus gracilis]|uniref:DNA-binding protein n=1 Tax=Rhodocyclus tenuis TaxID=1066 RepID=A0A6L5JZK4_RHOTE|nr:DNA-binding protein [Rhodocyclus gracilis]MQY52536.1 DNA-binding protein [Rhodocyclus gracilis]
METEAITTADRLVKTYGLLMTIADVSQVFKRSPAALRQSIARCDGIGGDLVHSKFRRGRRVYFRSVDVAKIIDGDPS